MAAKLIERGADVNARANGKPVTRIPRE